MQKKQLWIIIASLIMLNCLTVVFFLTKGDLFAGSEEGVASIGKETITRQQWLTELENRYGKAVLKDLIDQKVIETLADKYKISVSNEAIEHELLMVKTLYGSFGEEQASVEKWKEQIRFSLLLEELLTRDVVVSEEEMKAYYDDNSSIYNVPASFHLSKIVVPTEKDANQTIKELEKGSNFAALAMERSIDEFSANQGGDMGYVNEEAEHISPQLLKQIKNMKPETYSHPILTEDGYMIVYVHEKIEGKEYTFDEVKNQIRRQIALEQMDVPVTAASFWKEVKVDWFYGEGAK
ncbi:peptidyl-prolyl cis-trans isomerase [Cytobacillus spongiae]|uniref:peptidyl-prolyl cis-trans isomerase n=1 Tax=Cytobacillus spongiae TaxID=2901381 RepID=UPI001F1D441C|nr:peptidyl-prolyl cis-trans isomerase [Cytobacillus spongiae]UII56029.1 peptidyl-prolyl cis-trans isomerase [Cytobacillus spongiae]